MDAMSKASYPIMASDNYTDVRGDAFSLLSRTVSAATPLAGGIVGGSEPERPNILLGVTGKLR